MTVIPPGAKLAPVDLPPPPPSADPREPESSGRRTRTPQRGARSPFSSRASSPTRGDTSPPLVAPLPRSGSVGSSTALSPKAAGAAAGLSHAQPQSQNQSPLSPHATLSATSLSPTSTSLGAASYAAVGSGPHGHSTLSRPSSPSSIHSSGSAIFERDIEVPAVASLSLNSAPTLSHKSSRIFHPHGSNLELTVPAVLDDAVEALTAQDNVEIEAPAPTGMARSASTGVAVSPALRARVASMPPQGLMGLGVNAGSLSHSPSPPSSPSQGHILNSLNTQISPLALASTPGAALSPMASLPAPLVGTAARSGSGSSPSPPAPAATSDTLSTASSPTSPVSPTQAQQKHRPAPLRQLSGSALMPGGWAFEEDAGGATAVKEEPGANPHVNPASASAASAATTSPIGLGPGPGLGSALPSHLTPTKDKRRISFISYNDLLLSVPTQVTSLGEITSGNLSPDHLPGTVSPSVASRSPVIAAASPAVFPGASLPGGAGQPLSQTQTHAQVQAGQHPAEWTREGLGRGLEQRLEDLVMYDK